MKLSLLSFTLITFSAMGQSFNFSYLDQNNTSALITDGGVFFEDIMLSAPAYEVPKGAGTNTMYSMSFWMYGTDELMAHHSSYCTYSTQVELGAGPIADDYNSAYYQDKFTTSLWSITQSEIDTHLGNYMNAGYVVPAAIADWPGSGDPAEGVAANLAPYIDANGNGVYDPENGDAPYIEGDKATYVIMNDVNAPDVVWGPPLEVEVHVMFYQYATADPLNNTTFFNVRVFNRGAHAYPDFKFGVFADFDLGNYQDDYWGCDSTDNYMFVYNGDNDDEDSGGMSGFGTNPPATGIVSLSHELSSAQTFNNGSEPTGYDNYYNMMMGYQANGAPHTHFDGYETKFQYSDELIEEYAEHNLGNPAGDRRGLMVISPGNVLSGTSFCADYAVVYHRDLSNDNIQNAIELDSIVDFVQSFYDQNIQACESYMAGTEEMEELELTVFPNPSNGVFTVQAEANTQLEIYSMSGQLIHREQLKTGFTTIDFHEAAGIYLLKAKSGEQMITKKIIIE